MDHTALGNKLTDENSSSFGKYRKLVVGDRSFGFFLFWEFYHLFISPVPGALGLLARQLFLPLLLAEIGAKVAVGRNVTFRHPHNIFLRNSILIDENCVLDAKGEGNEGIRIGDQVVIGRNTVLSCKGPKPGGYIAIGENSNIAMNCVIHSEEKVEIGRNVLISAYCYLVGGGNHNFSDPDIPIIQQTSTNKGGIVISEDVWLGARVTVTDGVEIGRGSVVGASALVKDSLPTYSISAGIPAKVIRERK